MSSSSSTSSPTPEEIISVAVSCGYMQRRPAVSSTLFFIERIPPPVSITASSPPPPVSGSSRTEETCVKINIYYTTRSIMTLINHPTTGMNELWRSNAYNDLNELRKFFENPRNHTGKGYRNAQKAIRGCVGCGEHKPRKEFSQNQWLKGPDGNKCKACINNNNNNNRNSSRGYSGDGGGSGSVSDLIHGLDHTTLEPDRTLSSLTQEALQSHNNTTQNQQQHGHRSIGGGVERRQFNCPDCPRHNRGEFIFFKKVPVMKPIVKCPKCKKATRGNCKRLYPIPRGSEKGYGLYKCDNCGDKWGSSRAVSNLGQECHGCSTTKGIIHLVTPFRIEVPRNNKDKKIGRRGMKRVPREPIGEDDVDEREYGIADQLRNITGGGGQGGGGGGTSSYDLEPRGDDDGNNNVKEEEDGGSGWTKVVAKGQHGIPPGYRHKCAGCATGICKNRKIPKSEVHDISDGNTVSTRASIVTNSSIDKSDFFDRDEDFSGFDVDVDDNDNNGGEPVWVNV